MITLQLFSVYLFILIEKMSSQKRSSIPLSKKGFAIFSSMYQNLNTPVNNGGYILYKMSFL